MTYPDDPAGVLATLSAVAAERVAAERARVRREEVEPLLAVLRSIASNTCCGSCREAGMVAQFALAAAEARKD